jgi:hypothetical protein
MRLERERGRALNAPTPQTVADTLRGLSDPDNRFAVLQAGYFRFLQAHVAEEGYLAVEVQHGSLAEHYELPMLLPVDTAVELFVNYLTGGTEWRSAFDWHRVPVSSDPPAREEAIDGLQVITDPGYADYVREERPLLVAFQPADRDTWADAQLAASLVLRRRRPHLLVGIVPAYRSADIRFEWGVAGGDPVIWLLLRQGRLEWVRRGPHTAEEFLAAVDGAIGNGDEPA